MAESLADLMRTLPQVGRVEEIWLRPARRAEPVSVQEATAACKSGLEGDRYRGRSDRSRRQVTLIQAEHLPVIAALSGHTAVSAGTLRRNLVVSGIPLVALKGRHFSIGEAVFAYTVPCDPCRRMEEALGPGGFNAMRGMGGICVRVVTPGSIRVGDPVAVLDEPPAGAGPEAGPTD